MARPTLLFAILVVAGLLSGCADGATKAAPDDGSRATVDLGSIGGIAFDDERRPLENVQVYLVEQGRTEWTDGGGRFAFLRIAQGTYTLRASLAGFHETQQVVTVSPGQAATVRLELAALPTQGAFHETSHFTAFLQCSLFTPYYASHCSSAYTTLIHTAQRSGVNLSSYGVPADVMQNRYRYNFTLRPDSTAVVSELIWTPNSDATRFMWLSLTCGWYDEVTDHCVGPMGGGAAGGTPVVYAHRRGPSPLRAEWSHPRPDWLPWVMSKTTITGDIEQSAGVSIDQRLEMYNTAFYGDLPPEDWTVRGPS